MNLKKHELNERLEKNEGFYKQMLKAEQNYKELKIHAHYENLSAVNQILVSKFEPDKTMAIDIYFVYGLYINEAKVSMDLITQYFVTVLPKPKKPYFFVYFNDYDSPNNFANFKDMLGIMPLEYFLNMEAIFLVRPSLRMKASRYFTFGTISKYINSKTVNIDTLEELSQRIGVKKHDVLKFLPLEVRNYFTPDNQQINSVELKVPISLGMVNSSGPTYNREKKISPNSSPRSGQQMQMMGSQKPNSSIISSSKIETSPILPKLEIDQYDKSERGIPEVFQIMIHYFREHTHELEEQGIFRKSVSIDDQNLALEKIQLKQYDYLEKSKDPHLIANLIKRFLSKLKTPIIPYSIFDHLMNKQPLNSVLVSEQMKNLSNLHLTKYLTLAILLDFLIRKVIPRSHKNKMPAQNVAICFAPCLMWAQQRSFKDLTYINKSVAVVLIMINNFEEIFGSKKELNKVFRTSFYEQQKKNIVEAYNVQMPHQVQSLEQKRKTPNFGLLVLQKAQNEHKAQESDDSPLQQENEAKNKMKINIISPNKSTAKSHAEKTELVQIQKQLEQQQRKSQRPIKDKQIISEVYSPMIQVGAKVVTARKRIIFHSQIQSPKSQNSANIGAERKVSQNKSDKQINSIHSGRSDEKKVINP